MDLRSYITLCRTFSDALEGTLVLEAFNDWEIGSLCLGINHETLTRRCRENTARLRHYSFLSCV